LLSSYLPQRYAMPEITFVFGPNGSFFFDCPQVWKFDRIPGTLRQLFNSSMAPAWRIVQPYCVGLAPPINSLEPLWYVGCKVMTGEDKLFYSQTYFENSYADLCRWTKALPTASSSCFVTFGLGLSYFASAPGQGSIWAGIPSELEDKVRKSYETPCCVSLGMHDSWFVSWPGGACSWKFNGCYIPLEKILGEATPGSVSYVAISPYSDQHYFVAFRDQSVKYNFTGAPPEWMNLMTEAFDSMTTARLQMSQQQHLSSNGNTYPRVPLHPSPQPQQVAANYHNNNNLAEFPPSLNYGLPSPPLSTGYSDSKYPQPAPATAYPYRPPQQNAVEMPVELPDHTPSAPASITAASTGVRSLQSLFL
jgi:hypothetical protein